jgi:hypothetical protein
MNATICRGVVRGGTVVFLDPTPLAEGTEVVVLPVSAPGTPAAVLAAVQHAQHVPSEWVDELEQAIAEGRRTPTAADPFQDAS